MKGTSTRADERNIKRTSRETDCSHRGTSSGDECQDSRRGLCALPVPCTIEIDASDEEIEMLADDVYQMECDAWNFDDQELKKPEISLACTI